MDKLEEIFKMQYELNKRIGVDTAAMGDDERVKWVLNYSRALGQENAELVDSVPWKNERGRLLPGVRQKEPHKPRPPGFRLRGQRRKRLPLDLAPFF